jgi:phosphatidylglycerol:prolipoprotein diacylglycerol transferase
MSNAISFPGLGFSFDPPKIAFSVLGLEVKWYGIIIAIGFMLAFIYALKRTEQFGFSEDNLIDILLVAVPVAIICARGYFVIFNYDLFRGNPAKMFRIWEGGLAVYGGIIGGLVSAAIVARIKKIKPLAVLDLGALGFLIGQAVGRWANLINREAYGTVTNLPWRMEIYNASSGMRAAVHPCFLYESLWNILGFVLLHFASKKRKYDGQVLLGYLGWYGLGRALIEGLRTDSLYLFGTGIRISQFIGLASFFAALVIIVYIRLFKSAGFGELQAAAYQREKAADAISKAAGSVKAPAPGNEEFRIEAYLTVEESESVTVTDTAAPEDTEVENRGETGDAENENDNNTNPK